MKSSKSEHISTFFQSDFPLNQEGLEELISSFQLKTFPKHTSYLLQGEVDRKLRFMNAGVVREFYASKGKETNIYFYTHPQFITDFPSFMHQTASLKNQESLTEIEILELDRPIFLNLLDKYQCGKSFIDLTFQKILRYKELAEYDRMTKDPEQLYKEIQLNRPHWLKMIPQYHIASYLGISPETLSRIRKRIS